MSRGPWNDPVLRYMQAISPPAGDGLAGRATVVLGNPDGSGKQMFVHQIQIGGYSPTDSAFIIISVHTMALGTTYPGASVGTLGPAAGSFLPVSCDPRGQHRDSSVPASKMDSYYGLTGGLGGTDNGRRIYQLGLVIGGYWNIVLKPNVLLRPNTYLSVQPTSTSTDLVVDTAVHWVETREDGMVHGEAWARGV